jgi:hypothetical protein
VNLKKLLSEIKKIYIILGQSGARVDGAEEGSRARVDWAEEDSGADEMESEGDPESWKNMFS